MTDPIDLIDRDRRDRSPYSLASAVLLRERLGRLTGLSRAVKRARTHQNP